VAGKSAEQIYVGLDIGSTKVCCVVGLHEEGSALPSVIGVGVAPTSGMRKGVVVDVEETVSAITAAVDEAERISGIAIDQATISIDGAHVTSQNSKGVIAVGRADQEIYGGRSGAGRRGGYSDSAAPESRDHSGFPEVVFG